MAKTTTEREGKAGDSNTLATLPADLLGWSSHLGQRTGTDLEPPGQGCLTKAYGNSS